MELTRRGFLKSVGAATLAVAAVGLLGGCEGGEMVGNANGLNDTAELKGIKMTVRSLAFASYSNAPSIWCRKCSSTTAARPGSR